MFIRSVPFNVAAMNILDGDDVRLSSRGRYAERDIVQVRNILQIKIKLQKRECVQMFVIDRSTIEY